jgi:hypothetical protein
MKKYPFLLDWKHVSFELARKVKKPSLNTGRIMGKEGWR